MAGKKKNISGRKKAVQKRQKQKELKKKRWIFAFFTVMIMSTLLTAAYFLGSSRHSVVQKSTLNLNEKQPKAKLDITHSKNHIAKKTFEVYEEYPKSEKIGFGLEDLIKKTRNHSLRTLHEAKITKGKPLLVLIIDDVSQKRQLAAIHALPFHITPSIFPPSQMNRYSYRLARGLKHYMIHLPMQSSSAKMNRFTKTMKITDSNERIAARIQEIRKFFPTAVFVNNHTGSVFTSNYAAMRRAYIELKRNGFIFIDSRTTSHSVVRKITKIYKAPYIARDIFLDNVQKRSAILAQLKKAVRIAKQRGYAIAIGHPHPATLDALKHAKSVLASVQTVYIDEFYRRIYGRITYH